MKKITTPSSHANRLLKAVREMKAMQRGIIAPARAIEVTPDKAGGNSRRKLDPEAFRQQQASAYAASIAGVRGKLNFSQQQFADMLGISRRTLENWEQGHREPTGAAKVLIKVAAKHPKAVLEAVA